MGPPSTRKGRGKAEFLELLPDLSSLAVKEGKGQKILDPVDVYGIQVTTDQSGAVELTGCRCSGLNLFPATAGIDVGVKMGTENSKCTQIRVHRSSQGNAAAVVDFHINPFQVDDLGVA